MNDSLNKKYNAIIYFAKILLLCYFLILFVERLLAVLFGFLVKDYIFYTSDYYLDWYTHIATAVSLLLFLIFGSSEVAKLIRGIFVKPTNSTEFNYRRCSYAAGLILIGGMIHTNFTFLTLQFAAYGCLLISMLLVTIAKSLEPRYDTSKLRLVLSFIYILCFSMAIPVVYGTALAPLEMAVSLLLVGIFTLMLKEYYVSGGRVRVGLPIILFTVLCDAAIIVLGWNNSPNIFLMVFAALAAIVWIILRITCGNKCIYDFFGYNYKKSYFEGWYVKLVNDNVSLAFILSYHLDERGESSGMLQVITTGQSMRCDYAGNEFKAKEYRLDAELGKCHLTENGLSVDAQCGEHKVTADLKFGKIKPLKSDIMGAFVGIPFMECRHGVISMKNAVSGKVTIDENEYIFENEACYIEKDSGHSFPSAYKWTQALGENYSVMLAVATIPYMGIKFNGVISNIKVGEKNYRLATYNLARLKKSSDKYILIKRGKYTLEVTALKTDGHALAAPEKGKMSVTIHESVNAEVRYILRKGKKELLNVVNNKAGFEGHGLLTLSLTAKNA